MTKIRDKSTQLLARREHAKTELARKLARSGFSDEDISTELESLSRDDLQSDERFAESYVRARKMAGFGPRRIAVELRSRGVSDALIETYINEGAEEWWEQMLSICQRRFSKQDRQDKQFRFLLQRGYTSEMIRRWFRFQKVNSDE